MPHVLPFEKKSFVNKSVIMKSTVAPPSVRFKIKLIKCLTICKDLFYIVNINDKKKFDRIFFVILSQCADIRQGCSRSENITRKWWWWIHYYWMRMFSRAPSSPFFRTLPTTKININSLLAFFNDLKSYIFVSIVTMHSKQTLFRNKRFMLE